ncbi:MAG TPA: ferrochelatase [Rhizomicrobium sp.]|jgi:ferrochelatase|nr:ferrochelatase [Rhizomicrobium sp.]
MPEKIVKLAVVLFNLGGPDSLAAVEPFLRNLFSDPAILAVPGVVRKPLAWFIARRRAPVARAIYARLGDASPIVAETQRQSAALDGLLAQHGIEAKCFIAMRCWHPFSDEAVRAAKAWGAERVVLLPLYPQFSTTTTASSFADWDRAARRAGLELPTARICCYPDSRGFVAASAALIREVLAKTRPGLGYRLLLSAHGLPKRTIARGDPYQWQVERTAAAIVDALGMDGLDWKVCYQSRVGPLEWIGPATDSEIRRAGADGKGVIVAPIAFVSEHSETLVELDIEYAHLAKLAGVADYLRVPTVGIHPDFVAALADLVLRGSTVQGTISAGGVRLCLDSFGACPCGRI